MKPLLFAALLAASGLPGATLSNSPDIVLQSGHGANISALAFSPDGKFLATASEDASIRLWDPSSGAALRVLRGHSNIVTALAISRDGTRIASASLDHTLRVWNAATGEQEALLRGASPAAVNLLKLTPDATSLVTAETVAAGTILRIWDIRTAKQTRLIKRDDAAVSHIFFNQTGSNMIVAEEAGDDEAAGAMTTYQWATGRSLQTRPLLLCGASDDGKWLALDQSTDSGRKAMIVDAAQFTAVSSLSGQVSRVSFSGNGEWVAYESAAGNVAVVQRTAGGSAHTIHGRGAEFSMLAISSDGRLLATAGADYSVHIWDVASGKLSHGEPGQVTPSALAFSPDGRFIALNGGGADLGSALQVWDIDRRAMVAAPRIKRPVVGVSFSHDGAALAVSSPGLELFDRRSNSSLNKLKCNESAATSPAFSSDGRWIAANCGGVVTVWSVASGSELFHFGDLNDANVGPLAFNGESSLLAAGSGVGISVYDTTTRKSVLNIRTHNPVSALAINDQTLAFGTHAAAPPKTDEKTLAPVAPVASLYAVDIHSKRKLWGTAAGPWVSVIKFTGGGKTLLVVSGGLTAYDAATGHATRSLLARVPGAASAVFSPNAEWLAAGVNAGASLWRLHLE